MPNSSESKTNRALSPIIWAVSRELSKPITIGVSPSQTCHSHRSGLRGITLTSSRRGLLDILRICAPACPFSSPEACHNQTDPLPRAGKCPTLGAYSQDGKNRRCISRRSRSCCACGDLLAMDVEGAQMNPPLCRPDPEVPRVSAPQRNGWQKATGCAL